MHVPMLINDFLKRAVYLYPQKVAVIEGEKRITYKELQERVNRLANTLRSLGVNKGDRVAYLSPNTLAMFEGFYAVMQIGAIMVPLNTRLIPDDYNYIVNHCGAKVFCVDADLNHLINPIRDQLDKVEHFILLPNEKRATEEGWLTYDALLEEASPAYYAAEMEETDSATILYTSGTTGRPKGVIQSHRSLYFNALNTIIHLRATDQDVLLHTLPMFHVNGWGTPFSFTGMGATHVMLRKIDPPLIFDLLKNEGVTVACMAPTVLNMLLNEPKAKVTTLNQSVRVTIAGSAPPPSFVKAVEKELGWEFIQVYGMTECAPFLTIAHVKPHIAEQGEDKIHQVKAKAGLNMLNVELRVVDSEGEDVIPNGQDVGEVIARSNVVMDGYWQQPEETAKAIVNGWYHTGDMGTIDEEGYIEIVDRKKDIIISGGENISSIEVEGTLYEHPAVLEAAIIAIPHERWGEIPHAVVVLREGHEDVTEKDIINFCRERMAHFKCPKSVSFINELPKTASGKIQKVVLRQPFWENQERKVN